MKYKEHSCKITSLTIITIIPGRTRAAWRAGIAFLANSSPHSLWPSRTLRILYITICKQYIYNYEID